MNILKIQNISKSYGLKKALNGISFDINEGDFIGLLGENGAGKSTLLNIISSNLKCDSGEIYYQGELINSSKNIKRDLGIVYQNSVLDKNLTVQENLYVRGSLYNLNKEEIKNKVNELSNDFDLNPILNQRYGTLSGGQKRKIDIARALIHSPKFLILDEPTTGLDPDIRKTLWEIIETLKNKNNLTILLTTHYMEETNACDYIVMLDKGEIIKKGTPNDLKIMFSSKKLSLYSNKIEKLKEFLRNKKLDFIVSKDKINILIEDSFYALELLNECKNLITSFEVLNGTMDDMFLKIKKGGV